MKNKLTYTLLLAAASCGVALGQTTAYTTPVGYTTQALAPSSFNLVGINVQTSTVVAGKLTGVSGAVLSDSATNFSTVLTLGKTYVMEIKSGPGTADGTTQDFTIFSGNTVTLPAAVAGIATGDTYSIRVAPTLPDIFTGTSVTPGFSAAGADIIWIPDGAGNYIKYWKNSATWRQLVAGTASDPVATNVAVLYTDGILVQKKATPTSLVLSGEVKTTGSNALLVPGFNPVSIVAPVGLTLFNAGLIGDLTPGFSASGADIVWVPIGGGLYNKYGLKSPAPGTWFKLTAAGVFEALASPDVSLPPAVLIQRKVGSKVISLDVPASYSNL